MNAIDLEELLPKYATTEQVATLAGKDKKWIHAQGHRAHVAEPTLTKGTRQFSRLDTLKLIILARLQRAFGVSSPLPFAIVKAAEPEIAALLTDPNAGTLLILRSEDCPLNIVVSVPSLKALLA